MASARSLPNVGVMPGLDEQSCVVRPNCMLLVLLELRPLGLLD